MSEQTEKAAQAEFDVFLSHGKPDKHWVKQLRAELKALDLRAFVDEDDLETGPYPERLSDSLECSRFLAVIVSPGTTTRPWVTAEWTAFHAKHGPLDRVIVIYKEAVELPMILRACEGIEVAGKSVKEVAQILARLVASPEKARRIEPIGAKFPFVLNVKTTTFTDEQGKPIERVVLCVTGPDGLTHEREPFGSEFGTAQMFFRKLSREAADSDAKRAELSKRAKVLGCGLMEFLFGADTHLLQRFREVVRTPARLRPVVQISSDDDVLLSLPWELLYLDDAFLVREGRVDLVRTTTMHVDPELLLRQPERPFDVIVHVSAPLSSGLDYEGESYRITKAMLGQCKMVPTELGTLGDLVKAIDLGKPRGAHFSGHGGPGELLFEDEFGDDERIAVDRLVGELRKSPSGTFPPFFYLACCHGNDVGQGAESAAGRLHREGVTQVVAYSGPIVDALSTRAEAALYGHLSAGRSTREAVRAARLALANPGALENDRCRPRDQDLTSETLRSVGRAFPFAWSQLVFYHRGPDWPLGQPQAGDPTAAQEATLERHVEEMGTARQRLSTGFVGRRRELHQIRRKVKTGQRILVFQGLGGLGKSTLAFHTLPLVAAAQRLVLDCWCQETAGQSDPLVPLSDQLLSHVKRLFGEQAHALLAHKVDPQAPNAAIRFLMLLDWIAQNHDAGIVVYFDNLESLLTGPDDERGADSRIAFADWKTPELGEWWQQLARFAKSGKLWIVASTRYLNSDLENHAVPVGPLPHDALYRMMGWFPSLRRVSHAARLRLVARLGGHPRAVEYLNDLLTDALARWDRRRGRWQLPPNPNGEQLENEWSELISPALPVVEDRLTDNLLLDQIWKHVLDDAERRMLFRMTLLRRPWDWDLMRVLGDPGEEVTVVESRAERLTRTSLLQQITVTVRADSGSSELRRFELHPTTARFVGAALFKESELRQRAHLAIGEYLEVRVGPSSPIEQDLEAGHHLFEAREVDRSLEVLVRASQGLQLYGRVRQGLEILEPFLGSNTLAALSCDGRGRLLGTVGVAFHRLGDARKAIEYYEKQLEIVREMENRRGEGNALGNLGLACADLGDVRKAIECYEKALVILRETRDRQGEGNVLGNLGLAHADLGEMRKAIECYEKRLLIAREIRDRRGEGNALGNLGVAHADLGDVQKAIEHYEDQLLIASEIEDLQGAANALGGLGPAYARLGDAHRAIECLEKSLLIARNIGDRLGEGNSLGNLGVVYEALGESELARVHVMNALSIGRDIGNAQIIRVCEAQLKALGN